MPLSLKTGQIGLLVQKVEHCSETKKKSIHSFFRYGFQNSEISVKNGQKKFGPRRFLMFWNGFSINLDNF